MRLTTVKRLHGLLLALFAGLLPACASVSPWGTTGQFDLAEDEKRIWNRSIEEAKRLDESGQLYGSPETVEYVNGVALKLVPQTLRASEPFDIRVRIIKNPLLNAFALSHGAIYIHTGMLAKLEDESQLATILAHELAHITHRHPVQHFRTIQNVTTAMALLQIAALPAGPYGSVVGLLGAMGATAAVSGYSRSMESEADANGLRLTIQAGYDPSQAPKLFEYIQKELEERKIDEPFFFGSHPRLQERKENYTALLAREYAGKTGKKGDEEFAASIYPLLLDNAQMDLSLGRWSWAEEAIRRAMNITPADPSGHYHLGEMFRRRAQEKDLEQGEQSYRSALECDEAFAPAYRGLGLIYLKQGKKEEAQAAFARYLVLSPQAEDRAYIEQYLPKSDGKK
jgi:predicted Zn-dependent protease